MPTENDPLADDQRCGCEAGWISVGRSYALAQFPEPTLEDLAELTDDEANERRLTLDRQRAAAANSVYPCRVHKPAQFAQWAAGHYAQGHDRSTCPECRALDGRASGRRRAEPRDLVRDGPAPLPERRDLA